MAKREWRIALVAIGVAVVVLGVAAALLFSFSPHRDDPDNGVGAFGAVGATDIVTATATPSATPSPTVAPSSAPASQTQGPPQAPSYPGSADDYAMAALTAWLNHNDTRLGQLATPSAITLFGSAPTGLPGGWEFYDCWNEPFSPCRELRNDQGDVVGISVDPSLVGKAKAVTRVYIDLTKYPSTVMNYLYGTLDAWYANNTERVATMIDGQQAVWFFTSLAHFGDHNAFSNYTQPYLGSTGLTCVAADGPPPSSANWSWGFDVSKLGGQHALVWAGEGYDDPSPVCH
jgi:hypothetical protein